MSHLIDQELDLHPMRKCKVQKLTDLNTEQWMIRSRKLLSKFTQKTAFFNNEKIAKVKQLYNFHNDVHLCFFLRNKLLRI